MNSVNKTSRIWGLAFLLQFNTTVASAMFRRAIWFVTGNMGESMIKIPNNAWSRSKPKC
jgi:hypothetical protein